MSGNDTKNYYLGKEYPDVYFTQREMDCLVQLLNGHTLAGTAEILSLSPRTVEFYVKNMRMKLGVQSKIELLKKIRKMDFIEHCNIHPLYKSVSFRSTSEG